MKRALYSILAAVFCFWLGAGSTAAHAQEAPSPSKVEPGYEMLAAAGQLAKSSPALDAATESGATLTQKRRAVADKSVAQALEMMRRWLDTPLPPPSMPDSYGEGIVPLLSGVRALGRALYVRNYVLLADGRVGEAIEGLRDGLRLNYAIGHYTMSSWLCGYVVEAILMKSLVTHLDQLSAHDCDSLFRLAQEWANASDPLPTVLERGRRMQLALIQKAATDEGFRSAIHELADSSNEAQLAAQMERLNPQARQQMIAQVAADCEAVYEQAQVALRTPYWERTPQAAPPKPEALPNGSLAKQLEATFMPDLDRATDQYTRVQSIARMLACHAAIRRYRWEHDSLPPSLSELKIGNMALDPFTGKPFVYKTEGTHYTLESVGPLARDENGHPLTEKHTPVTLTSEK